MYPGTHKGIQLASAVLPGAETVEAGHCQHSCRDTLYVSAGQASQGMILLATALYVPASHAAHIGLHGGSGHASAVYPLSHRHMLALSEPEIDCEFSGHDSMSLPE